MKNFYFFSGILKKYGLTPSERFFTIDNLYEDSTFPIVEDGLNGIRVTFEEGILNLWFTNRFENPDNEIRVKIKSEWDKLNKNN